MDPQDKIITILSSGLIFLITLIVLFDFLIALKSGRPPDSDVVELLKMSVTGIVGIVAGYLGGKNRK